MSSRTRTMGSIVETPVNTYLKTVRCNGTTTQVDSYPTQLRNGETVTTHDFVTPNYARKSREGKIINNSFSTDRLSVTALCGGYDRTTRIATCSGTTTKYTEAGPWAGSFDVEISDPDHAAALNNARLIAGTAAMAGIEEPDVMGLVELAELKKTAKMIPDMVARAQDLLRTLARHRRYRKSSARNILEYVGSQYLGARYGITPLIGTLNDLTRSIADDTIRRPKRLTSRGFSDTGQYGSSWADKDGGCTGTYLCKYTGQKYLSSSVRAGVLYEHTLSFDKYGLSIQQLPSAAWELLPYSFVADWFLNAGDFIAAVTPKAGVRVLSSWTTVETRVDFQQRMHTVVGTIPSGYEVTCGRTSDTAATRVLKTRTPGASVGLAWKFHEIRFERPKDFLHAADAIALLRRTLLGL